MKTIRQRIVDCLSEGTMTAIEISQELGIREKEVYEHLPHVGRSLTSQGKRFVVHPSSCLDCGYVFEERKRLTRPGRCPRCKGSRLQRPAYEIR